MTKPKAWLDSYERRARLTPGLLALLPFVIVLASLGWKELKVVSVIGSALVTTGGPILLANAVRTAGLNAEKQLLKQWGGWPTTLLLRMRAGEANPALRDAWRDAVETITQETLPTTDLERRRPEYALGRYDVAVGKLREVMRRNDDSGLILRENANYGFARNVYGIRWAGVAVSAAAVAVLAVSLFVGSFSKVSVGIGLCASVLALASWIMLLAPGRVRMAADKYATQVLNSAMHYASTIRN